MRQDKKTGRILPAYTKEEFNLLVNLIRTADPVNVYEYLNQLAEDERTKWRILDKAIEQAKKTNA